MSWIELLGYIASAAVFATFCMTTMLPLRLLAVVSNVLFVAYGYFGGVYPVFVLHLILFPINVYRLMQIQLLVRQIGAAVGSGISFKNLLPLMTRRIIPAGTVLFRKGDTADRLYYVSQGSLRIEEIGKELGPGEVIGEIGLFAPDRRRTASVVCQTECELFELGEGKAKELYFQNPSFAFALLQLIVARLIENNPAMADASARETSPG
ncbi:MAG: cyclic nucleotide-binding domain-containing protein [Xanthobacteraceae bacterium]